MVSTRKGASQSSSSSQAIAPQPQPQRQQRTRAPAAAAAAAYAPPPRPILPQAIADAPQGPQKRSVEEIEGIEEREISPKTKAKAKSTTTKAEASDPRALSLEEQARAETILNTFMRKEVKFVTEINVDEIEDHLKNEINKPGELQKELDSYIRRNMVLRPEVYVKLKSFLHERIESIIKPHIIYEIEEVLKTKLTKEISDLEQEHRVLSQDYNKQLGVIKDIDKELKKPKD